MISTSIRSDWNPAASIAARKSARKRSLLSDFGETLIARRKAPGQPLAARQAWSTMAESHFLEPPGFGGDRYEDRGRNRTDDRMVPARQHFESGDRAVLQIDQRLEMGGDPPAANRLVERRFDDPAAIDRLLHRLVEEGDRAGAALLGLVQRQVAAAQHLDGDRRRRAPRAERQLRRPGVERKRQLGAVGQFDAAQSVDQPAEQRCGPRGEGRRGAVQQQVEMFAVEAGDQVGGPHAASQPLGDCGDDGLGGLEPLHVGDHFQV